MQIMQGDAYYIAITLTDDDDEPITDGTVYITLGTLVKEVTYSAEEEAWLFPLSQEESFALDSLLSDSLRPHRQQHARTPCPSSIYIILEKGMATHSSVLAWRIPWTEEPGGL